MPFRSSLTRLAERFRLPRSNLTPAQAAQRTAVTAARSALRDAERRHIARVRSARREVRRTERAHASVVRTARKEHQRAERAAEGAIGEAGRKLPRPAGARELGAYGSFLLYEDRLDTGFGIMPLTASFRAFVAAAPALGQPAEVGVPDRIVDERGRSRRRLNAKRMYMVLHGAEARLLVESRDEEAAREFAQLVRVAALNVERITNARREAEAGVEGQLAGVRMEQAGQVDEARVRLEAAEADRESVEAAERALAEAEADTAEIERLHAELAAIERAEQPVA